MEKWEHYKKQAARAAESAFADKQTREAGASEHLATLFRQWETKFSRAVALLSLVHKLAPFDLKYTYKKENLAIDPKKYEFKEGAIGRGGENDVYLLESKEPDSPSWVLKVNRQDQGDINRLVVRAQEIKRDYERIKSWYEDIPGLIPQEYTVIMEDPRDGKPAIITLQQYMGTHMRDVFRAMNTENMEQLFAQSPEVRDELVRFIRISEQREAETGEMVDLLGPKNLSFIEEAGNDHLIVLDPHLMSHTFKSEEDIKRRQRARLDYLKTRVGDEDK